LRIGIWSMIDTNAGPVSILPGDGVGVFVHNLVGGLMELEEPVEVALIVHPRDQEPLTAYHGRHGSRVRVLSRPRQEIPRRRRLAEFLAAWVHRSDRLRARQQALRTWFADLQILAGQTASHAARPLLNWLQRRSKPALAALALTLPLALLLFWAGYATVVIGAAVLSVLTLPLRWLDRGLRWLQARPRFQIPEPIPPDADPTIPELAGVIAEAACDVWLLPSLLCNHDIHLPSVQIIHDLVTYHFPDFFDPAFVNKIGILAPLRARQALLVACMSAFIRDHDLLGLLELSPAKVRMVPSATPMDFPKLSDEEAAALRPAVLRRPYLFCPTAFRPHKNVHGLIKAMRRLRDRYGAGELDLVLTGPAPGALLPQHQRLVEAYGLEGRVHVLGPVDARRLAALYRGAFATLVPSLYEQASYQIAEQTDRLPCAPTPPCQYERASYQIAEALLAGCPVACSRIPPFLEQCQALGKAMLYFDPGEPDSIARTVLTIRSYRAAVIRRQQEASRALWQRTWQQVAAEWLPIFQETFEISRWPAEYRERAVRRPWPTEPVAPPRPDEPLEAFLFLQHPYLGGVWESTKDLIKELLALNERRHRLRITLGIQEEQVDVEALRQIAGDVPIERMKFEVLTQAEAARMLPGPPSQFGMRSDRVYCFWSACARTALRADAWLALCDRFHNALVPARPYGVVIHDMIQRHVPQVFSSIFFQWRDRGMIPTIQGARTVMITSPATGEDVLAEYGLKPERLRLVPVACEPQRRFGRLTPEHVPLPDRPFLLHAANTGEHKGAGAVLRACGRLKERLGDQAPLLVVCGGYTEYFSPSRENTIVRDELHWRNMRMLVRDLELEEGRDVVFLGFVSDRQLLDLYQRCRVVINAARYDNGSFCLIEGRYFGRPVVSSRYPAAESLCQRFAIPAAYFAIDDAAGLADQLARSMQELPLSGAALEEVRAHLADPEYTVHRYAERVYELLVDLAEHGRRERNLTGEIPLPSAA
jgi:glycosyltransferase involved in cell wall biosynthesis